LAASGKSLGDDGDMDIDAAKFRRDDTKLTTSGMLNHFVSVDHVIEYLTIDHGASQEPISRLGAKSDSSKIMNDECESGLGRLTPDVPIEAFCFEMTLNQA
jgi:hypothetical protein